jgi:hypothetical protein
MTRLPRYVIPGQPQHTRKWCLTPFLFFKNTLEEAFSNAEMLTRGDSFTLIHNPSRSFLQDAIETFQDTMGSGSKASKQLRSLLTDASNRGLSIDLFAHSQGGAITASAMRAGAISGVTLNFVGAPITESSARALAGFKSWSARSLDAVPMVLGRNGNLMQMLGAALNAPRLFLSCRNSPHSACAYAGGP